jgi:competence protein ComEC
MEALDQPPGPWRAIRRAAMLRYTVPFLLGLVLARFILPNWTVVLGLWGLSTVFFLFLANRSVDHALRWRRGATVLLWFFFTGLLMQVTRSPSADPRYIGHASDPAGRWMMTVESVNGVSTGTFRLDGQMIGRWQDDRVEPFSGSVMLTLLRTETDTVPHPGDVLMVDAPVERIDRVADPGGFDRVAWAVSRGMEHELFAPREDWAMVSSGRHWSDVFAGARAQVNAWLSVSGLPDRERALVKALVLGQRDEMERDQQTAFVRSGTIHVLAVSGMHVGMIFIMVSQLLSFLGTGLKGRRLRGVLAMVVLWAYAGLTGGTPSVLRATVMFTIFLVANMREQRPDRLNTLFVACFLLLVWDPSMLVQASFQLSFLAVLGILLFLEPIEDLWSPDNWVLRKLWSLAAVSIAAQAFTTPVSLYLFKAFPVWFLPANLIVVTAIGIAVPAAIALIAFHAIPYVGPLIAFLLTLLLRFTGWATDLFAWLPGAYPAFRIGAFDMLLLYVLVMAMGAWWIWRWRSMRWVLSATLLLLLGSWGLRAKENVERSTFTVYDDRHTMRAALSVGRQLTVLSADTTDAFLRMKVDRHARAIGAGTVTMMDLRTLSSDTSMCGTTHCAGGGAWSSENIEVAFLSGELNVAPTLPHSVDALVLHDLDRLDTMALVGLEARTERLVLAGKLRWRHRQQLHAWAEREGVSLHDVRDDGAFLLVP